MAKFVIVIGDGFNTVEQRSKFAYFIATQMKKQVASGFVVIGTSEALVPEGDTLKGLLLEAEKSYGSLSMSKIISVEERSAIIAEELKFARKKLETIETFNIHGEHEIVIFYEESSVQTVKFFARKLFGGQITVTPFNSGKSYKEKLKQLFIVTPLAILAFHFPNFRWLQEKQRAVLG
ncbi:MAG: hypothetical protein AAB503_01490 [Patescibacteria group bacterium]